MKEKTQVDKVHYEFSDYRFLLYIYAFIIFCSMILYLILDMTELHYISISFKAITMISWISKWLISITTIVIVFFLMLKAININSIAHTPITKRFSIFSILWFIFNLIGQIFYWIKGIEAINSPYLIAKGGNVFFDWFMFGIALLAIVFQLIVWISLRSFFIVNDYGFSATHCKKIQNSLFLLIITVALMLYSSTSSIIINQNSISPTGIRLAYQLRHMIYFVVSIDILLIFGYFILGYRLRGLKITTDVSIPKNYKTDIQEKTQVTQLKQKFHGYGILLYLFTLVIFIQVPFGILFNTFISNSLVDSIITIFFILTYIVDIIIVLLLVIKAIKIKNIAHKPVASRFATFSILWFIFYTIDLFIFPIVMSMLPINNNIFNYFDQYTSYVIELLFYIFQLSVWISLRAFIKDKGDIFSSISRKVIQNSLLILIIASSIMLYSFLYDLISTVLHLGTSFPIVSYSGNIWPFVYNALVINFPTILFIIGYILLGYRLIKLKNSPYVPIYERNKL